MAHSLSAKKRMRQNAQHKSRNRARKALVKGSLRTFDEAVAAGDAAKAQEAMKAAVKRVDRVAAKGTMHKNTAARKKSQLQRKLNAMKKA